MTDLGNKVFPSSFTAQYNGHMLVYYEIHSTYLEAARREERFKNWCRKWKLNLNVNSPYYVKLLSLSSSLNSLFSSHSTKVT